MGQVVDISTDGKPQQMSQEPNKERAYDEHVSYQRQFDQQRVAHGLDPIAASSQSGGPVPVAVDDPALLTAEDGPQSIYQEKFADLGLADFMQSILDEKKAERDAEKSTEDRGKSKVNETDQTQDYPSQIGPQPGHQISVRDPAQSMGKTPAQTHSRGPYQILQTGDSACSHAGILDGMSSPKGTKPSPLGQMTNSLSALDIHIASHGGSTGAGLGQSRWNVLPEKSGRPSNGGASGGATRVKKENEPLASGSNWW